MQTGLSTKRLNQTFRKEWDLDAILPPYDTTVLINQQLTNDLHFAEMTALPIPYQGLVWRKGQHTSRLSLAAALRVANMPETHCKREVRCLETSSRNSPRSSTRSLMSLSFNTKIRESKHVVGRR